MLNHSGLMTTKESTKRQESTKKRIHQRTIKLAAVFCLDFDNGSEVYINGKINNDIDINGIDLDRYNIKIKEGKIYLIDK